MIRNKEMHLPMWRRFWLGIGATLTSLIVGLGASQVCADPTHANPNAHFKIHGVIDESTGLYETATAAFDQLVELSDKLEAGKAQPRELGAGQLAFIRLERSASRLMIYGEPAGAEMHMSWQAFATTVNTALQQFRGTPQGQKVTAELLRRLQSKAAVANRTKNVQQITKLIEANKFPEAEKALDAALDEIRADSAYLSESDRDAIYDIYKQVTGVVENRMRELRTRKAMQVRDEVAKAYFQKRDQLFAAADQALAELPRGGTAKFGEQTLNGPALVAEFAKQWGVVHLALMKAAAIDYAAPSGEGYAGRGNESLRGKWQQQAAELTQGALKRLAALVEAEAGAAPPNIAKARYVEYVQIFGTIAPRMSSPQALQPLEPALKKWRNEVDCCPR